MGGTNAKWLSWSILVDFVLCFLAKSDHHLRCPFVIHLYSLVSTLSLLFQSFFFNFIFLTNHISRFFREFLGEFAIYLPTVANWQIIHMHCLFSGTRKWWICRTNNSTNPYTDSWCCVFNVLYCLYNIIHGLGPFFSVLVSPFSVSSIL